VGSPKAALASRRGLDDDGIAALLGEAQEVLLVLHRAVRPGHDGDPRLHGGLAGGDLVAEAPLHLGGRPDEDEPGGLDAFREHGVLGQEPVPWVYGVDAALLGERDDLVDAQVGVDGALPLADEVGLVRLVAVERVPVLVGVDGEGADAELGGGAEDADRDLAAVRGHQLVDLAGGGGRGGHGGER
jgi:hypothetical protein